MTSQSFDLDYKRQQALLWLGNYLKDKSTPIEIDHMVDKVIRTAASLPDGSLYGFVSPPKNKYILLDKIPFWKQTDNYRDGNRTCFSSTCAMMVKHFVPGKIGNDDEYVKKVFFLGDTTDPTVQIRVLKNYGLTPVYSQKLDFSDLDRELEAGNPIAIGFLHRGPAYAPTGGHWALVVGRTEDQKAYILNDPYGSIGDGYTGPVERGYHVQYSKDMLSRRWLVEGSKSGWGITATLSDEYS